MRGSCEKGSLKRRDFLKLGLVTAAGGVGLAGIGDALVAVPAEGRPFKVPVYRTLGRTGLKITVVSFGAMLTPEHEVIRAALDLGVNYIDTARRYMNGRNEEVVARAIKGVRDKLYVATKIKPSSSTKKEVFEDVETSLSKLGTDHIDVIQMHNLTRAGQILAPEVREAFLQLRKQGKVRFFGVTTHTNQAEVMNALVDDPDRFFDTVLVAYNFKSGREIHDAIARAAGAGIGVVAMKTQAGGYEASALGSLSPHQAALRWVLQNPHVTAAIPGMKDMSHLREDLSVMGMMNLTARDERILARYGEAIRGEYCHMCGACEGSCPNHVAISTINRCLMYAKAYGSMELASSTYREIGPSSSPYACRSCADCLVTCAHGVNVRVKMEEASRLFA